MVSPNYVAHPRDRLAVATEVAMPWYRPYALAGTMLLLSPTQAPSQYPRRPADRLMEVDEEGVLRWQDDGGEVALFGVNYYTPCSIDYASVEALGVDHDLTIRQDVAHFERMGLDAIRLHVFDREISDEQGNLIDNHHLHLLDYLIARCKQRGIYTVLTPIAWWGSPEYTHGFSDVYDKAQMYVEPAAIEAQANYLRHFVTHKNRYTNLTYADDPAVPVFEIINEPIPAPGTDDEVIISYIDTLCDAIRGTGCTKPIFFNGWGGRLDAVGRSKADGCTFGWYPTGLVSGKMLTANFLPRVEDYPSMRSPELEGKAKIVYEFDAADVPGSYMYPAMARAFRSGGAQIATQFQYDPLPVAPSNADWQTHYLNLAYTPKKAVSFAIAAEAFRRLPRLRTYGKRPESDRFGDFRVSYDEQLSEMATDELFMYSNDTAALLPWAAALRRIAGCGSSLVVQYDGTGAYFLDRMGEGFWRLEVYPDAVWVADPFGRVSLQREASRVYWRERTMTLNLPDLGESFAVTSLSDSDAKIREAAEGRFTVRPGLYLLKREGAAEPEGAISTEFVAPEQRDLPPVVWHIPPEGSLAGEAVEVEATVASAEDPTEVILHVQPTDGKSALALKLDPSGPYRYKGTVPGEWVKKGDLTYCISVRGLGDDLVFPDPGAGPVDERFAEREPVTILTVSGGQAAPDVNFGGAPGETAESAIVPGSAEGQFAVRVTATGFGPPPSAAGIRLPAQVAGDELSPYNVLRVRARRIEQGTSHLEVGLVEDDGSAHGFDVPLGPAFSDFRVPLLRLKRLWSTEREGVRPERLKEVSLVFGSWLFPDAGDQPHGVEIEQVGFEYEPAAWRVPVYGADDPIVLFAPDEPVAGVQSQVPYRQTVAAGSSPDATAWRLAVDGFGQPPNCTTVRADLTEVLEVRRPVLADYDILHLRARAGEPATRAIEVVLSEADGTPWGATPEISTEWQDIRIPLRDLRFFAHWNSAPENRGDANDACRVGNLAMLRTTYGAWLYPDTVDEPHSFEVEFVRLEKAKGR